jgi:hypothetical protein
MRIDPMNDRARSCVVDLDDAGLVPGLGGERIPGSPGDGTAQSRLGHHDAGRRDGAMQRVDGLGQR